MADVDKVLVGAVSPEPTEEEAAAIVAAIEVGLPRAVAVEDGRPPVPRWRFSGRWWIRPVSARRTRP